MPYDPPPELASLSLAEIADLARARKLPPIAEWNPTRSGESEMAIAADGRWFHQGGEITRPAMIRAFSSLLRCDDEGSYWLVSPQEKLRIDVAEAPFQAVELRSEGEGLSRSIAFRLNTDNLIVAGHDNRLELRGNPTIPWLHVRGGLWAKATRPVYYELIDLALAEGSDPLGLWSDGCFFPMAAST
jgi:uncharacterized protein